MQAGAGRNKFTVSPGGNPNALASRPGFPNFFFNRMKPSCFSFLAYVIGGFLCGIPVHTQAQDTVLVQASTIQTKWLKDGTATYLVYIKNGKEGLRQHVEFWTRTTRRTDYKGKNAIEITQQWEDKDSVVHAVHSVCDATTMQPYYHQFWWRALQIRPTIIRPARSATVDFMINSVTLNERVLSAADTGRSEKAVRAAYLTAVNQSPFNWHLDLETFSLLPYREHRSFSIPFYDPGTEYGFQRVIYTVTGSRQLQGIDGQKADCWVLEHKEEGDHEVFLVSKKTQEVLKLEERFGKSSYRYKIRLGFCD